MADRPVPLNSTGTLDHGKERRIITVYFHTDRYQGKCRLLAIKPKPGAPKEWQSSEVCPGADPDIWGAGFPDEDIPAGDYILEVQLKDNNGRVKPIRHYLQIDHAYRDVVSISGESAEYTKSPEPVLHEPLIGDGYSLEEAFVRLFNYKYIDTLEATIKQVTPKKEEGGESGEKAKAFATMIGVTKAFHDRLSAALGYMTPDNKYFRNFTKIHAMVENRPKSWKGLEKKILNLAGESGDAAFEHRAKRWGLKEWCEDVEKIQKPVEAIGKVFETYEQGEKLAEFIEAFNAVNEADLQFLNSVGKNFDVRNREELGRFPDFFSRWELMGLEAARQEADNRAGDAQNQGVGWTVNMVGLGLGVIFAEGFISSVLGEKVGKLFNVLGKIKSGLEKFDEWLFHAYIANRYRDVAEWWHDIGAVAHLDNSMFHIMVGRNTSSWEHNEYGLQFCFRAKVLYGLMKLIQECGSYEKNPASFKEKVQKNKIADYIDRYVLGGPFWVRNDHLTFDWVDHFHLEKDEAARNEVVRFQVPSEGGAQKESSTLATWNHWGCHGWTKIDFQKWFPIHFLDHKSIEDFAVEFSTDYSGVSEKHIATTFWQTASSEDWTYADGPNGAKVQVNREVTGWDVLINGDRINSERPVRAVIVLKENVPVRSGTPVTVQLRRVDWLNMNGPTYKGVIRRLSDKDLLPDSVVDANSRESVSGLKNRLGAILEFEYHYTWKGHAPSKIYQGLKPLKGSCHSAIAQNMSMAAWWTLGRNEAQGWIANGKEVELIPFKGINEEEPDFDRRNLAKFSDVDFLMRDTSSEEFSADVSKNDVTAIMQVKEDAGWKSLGEADKNYTVKFNQEVRVIIIVRQRPHFSPGIPAAVQVIRTDGTNAVGPVYRSEKMFSLTPFGLPGKWGTVIDLYHYVLDGENGKLIPLNGIKPVFRGSITSYDKISFKGFTFELRYRVGDSWGSKFWESWSSYESIKPDDLRFDMDGFDGNYQMGGKMDVNYVLEDDGSRKKIVLVNVPRNRREDFLKKYTQEHSLDADIFTEGGL